MLSKYVTDVIDKIGMNDDVTECAPEVRKTAQSTKVCSSNSAITTMKKWLETVNSDLDNIDNMDAFNVVEEVKQQTNCSDESCIYFVDSINLPKADLKKRFNPKGPSKSVDWLNNSNIDDVLSQYSKLKPKFEHIPYQMMDFKSIGSELSDIDWKNWLKHYDTLGCILNTDYSTGAGKHWVSIFVDKRKSPITVEYFDSGGALPPQEIVDFLVDTVGELTLLKQKAKDITVAKIQHQQGESECGVYSLFYIISRLFNVPYTLYEHNRIPDEDMEKFRRFLFRHT